MHYLWYGMKEISGLQKPNFQQSKLVKEQSRFSRHRGLFSFFQESIKEKLYLPPAIFLFPSNVVYENLSLLSLLIQSRA